MSKVNKDKLKKIVTVAVASKDLKDVPIVETPKDQKNFVDANKIKEVNIEDDDRDKRSK